MAALITTEHGEDWMHINGDDPNVGWLPTDILINITYYLSPRERLIGLTRINKSFHKMIYQPQCFRDIWIVPTLPKDLRQIKKAFLCFACKYDRYCIEGIYIFLILILAHFIFIHSSIYMHIQ